MNILVSACLLGMNCRYDGSGQLNEELVRLKETHNIIPVCPEIYGGLPTPREPAEILEQRVVTKGGLDVTDSFLKGAEESLRLARFYHCSHAILKERSPSCGFGKIYNGTFNHILIDGNGFTGDLLSMNGIKVLGESEIHTLFVK